MKKIATIVLIALMAFNNVSAQTDPIKTLEGEWLLKIETITPSPDSKEWTKNNTLVSFEPILDGKGLKRTTYEVYGENEAYFFYEAAKNKLYSVTVDENGYMWQTQMTLNGDGSFGKTTGGPVNDKTLTIESDLQMKSDTELAFTHVEKKDGKELLKVTGTYHKMPDIFPSK